jgi:hypothetical protein
VDREIPGARNTDPNTSHEADAKATFRHDHHLLIAEILFKYGPGTQYEIATRSNGKLTNVQVHRRMIEMERKRWVWRTEETRPSPTNRQCTVWSRYDQAHQFSGAQTSMVETPTMGQASLLEERTQSRSEGNPEA